MHYDFAGNIDRWGSKLEILILPVIAWIIYVFMTILEKFPEAWNTGVKVTEENKERIINNIKTCIIITHKTAALQVCNREFVIQDKILSCVEK